MIELLRQCGALMEKKLLNASKPPADAPMPTIKNEFDVRPAFSCGCPYPAIFCDDFCLCPFSLLPFATRLQILLDRKSRHTINQRAKRCLADVYGITLGRGNIEKYNIAARNWQGAGIRVVCFVLLPDVFNNIDPVRTWRPS